MATVSATYIEPLGPKEGTKDDLVRADLRFEHHPEQLTDFDLRLLAAYNMDRARAGFARRAHAMKAAGLTAAKPSAAAVEQVQAMRKAAWDRYVATMDAFIGLGANLAADEGARKAAAQELSDALADADEHVRPAEMVLILATWLQRINAKNAQRNARLDALEAQVSQVRADAK